MTNCHVKLLVLTTCPQCKAVADFLTAQNVVFEATYIDELPSKEREELLRQMAPHNPKKAFPVIFINNKAIIGFQKDALQKELEQL